MASNQLGFGQGQEDFNPVINLDDAAVDPIRSGIPQLSFHGQDEGSPTPGPLPLDDLSAVKNVEQVVVAGEEGRLTKFLGGVLVIFLMGAIFIHITGESDDPVQNLFSFFDQLLGLSEPSFEVVTEPTSVKPAEPPAPLPVPVANTFSPDMVGNNPYRLLPNPLASHPQPMAGIWTAADEERWRVALDHQFVYQRWKAVREMRAMRLEGSGELLMEALGQRKFWTRMEALMGLAEFGYQIDPPTVGRAIGTERSSLVKNYFMRFLKKRSPGELYIMRQALKVVDPAARVIILRGLVRETQQKDTNKLYLAAATYDDADLVRNWLSREYGSGTPAGVGLKEYQDIVLARQGQSTSLPTEEVGIVTTSGVAVEQDYDDVIDSIEFFEDSPVGEDEVFQVPVEKAPDDGFSDLIGN